MSNNTARLANTNKTRAEYLRKRLNALSLDLADCRTAEEKRSAKEAIRAAELELTALA